MQAVETIGAILWRWKQSKEELEQEFRVSLRRGRVIASADASRTVGVHQLQKKHALHRAREQECVRLALGVAAGRARSFGTPGK